MELPVFDQIFIHTSSLDSSVAKRIQSLYPAQIISIISDDTLYDNNSINTADEYNQSKRRLLLTTFKGDFFKRCPGATQKKSLTCCNYYVLNLGSQCNLNCSYCYLQSYLNSKVTKIYTNIDKALSELSVLAESASDQPFRVGTGEIVDSLSLDHLTLYSRQLIEFFKKYPQWILEFKTKSANVDQFLDLSGSRNIVVSWSVNPQFVISSEEHGTASLNQRLDAAKKCVARGYRVAFHIDPMIWHENWKKNYLDLAEQIAQNFKAEDIQVISIGSLRFQPEQRHLMRERFGFSSLVNQAEMFPSEGNKLRYDVDLRGQMLKHMHTSLKNFNPQFPIFFCMETPETWIKTLEKLPQQIPEIKDMFRPLNTNT